MEHVAERRAIPSQPCMVAWTKARDADIGETWLRIVGPGGAATCLVVDLPETRDRSLLNLDGATGGCAGQDGLGERRIAR